MSSNVGGSSAVEYRIKARRWTTAASWDELEDLSDSSVGPGRLRRRTWAPQVPDLGGEGGSTWTRGRRNLGARAAQPGRRGHRDQHGEGSGTCSAVASYHHGVHRLRPCCGQAWLPQARSLMTVKVTTWEASYKERPVSIE
jgi:hypothetical protein